MTWLGDIPYEVVGRPDGRVVRRFPDGVVQALGVRGRPGFAAGQAISGVLYRAEWLEIAVAADAPESGAAVFMAPEPLRAAGNCVHLTCSAGDAAARQWWCYRPRDYDDGTLSLLHEWVPNARLAAARGR
jgi:hypothetical protein